MEHTPKDQQNLDLLHEASRSVGCTDLSSEQLNQLLFFTSEFLQWNKKSNLTGFSSEKEVIGNLIADSLAALPLFQSNLQGKVMDIGTGGGIPGIPLKIALPTLFVTLVEPNQKKVAFLRLLIGRMGLKNIEVLSSRIEELTKDDANHGVFDWVVIKALRLESALPYVNNILSTAGKVICWRAEPARVLDDSWGLRFCDEVSHRLPFGLGERTLSILEKS